MSESIKLSSDIATGSQVDESPWDTAIRDAEAELRLILAPEGETSAGYKNL